MKLRHKLAQRITPFVPRFLRDWCRRHLHLADYDVARRKASNPYLGMHEENCAASDIRLGIIEDVWQTHKYYIAACKEMNISWCLIDLIADDWIDQVEKARCDAFLVWPSSCATIYKALFDSRLRILEEDLNRVVFPTWQECWLTEHKPRLRDWMITHHIPHPKSWVAYRRADAITIADGATYPIVGKSATGASGKGVRILKNRRELLLYIKQAFGKGIVLRGFDPHDRQRGYVYLQEYIPDAHEWRMVRIGESYFGYRKEKGESGMHSASHRWSWLDPGPELLELLKHVTEVGGFKSMDVDAFLTPAGELLVNECQTTFGCTTPVEQMKIDGVEGRYTNQDGAWVFEPGDFCRNHMCNLRVQYLLAHMAEQNRGGERTRGQVGAHGK